MKFNFKKMVCSGLICSMFAGCSTVHQSNELHDKVLDAISTQNGQSGQQVTPVITTNTGSFLMGQTIQVIPTLSPILTKDVIYHPAHKVSIVDVASWISQETGLIVDTAEVSATAMNQNNGVIGSGQQTNGQLFPSAPVLSPVGQIGSGNSNGVNGFAQPVQFNISYEGKLSGLLDIVANKAGVWEKFVDGKIVFFRTETETFYIPALAESSTGSSSITAATSSQASSGSSSGSSGSSSGSSGGSGGGSTSSGGSSSSSAYSVDIWTDLDKTAKTVGGLAQVVTNKTTGSITVTGTPTQVRNVRQWVKELSDNLSQQVQLDVHVYSVKMNNEDNYAWNPNVVFSGVGNKLGFNLTGPTVPAVVSGNAPLNFVASVLKTATGSTGQYSSSALAYQALSTVGKVTEHLSQTIVSLNGQPAPIQLANQLSYLAATTPGATVVGSAPLPPTLTPGQVTTGFTAVFIPRIINGKILLSLNITSSTLVSLGSVSSAGSSIQTPNVDINTFKQSVSLTPGDSLLLSGLNKSDSSTSNSGVGTAGNWLFGGGVDGTTGKQLIAIVVTAKVF